MTRQEKKPGLPLPEATTVAEAWGGREVLRAELLEGHPLLLTREQGGTPELWLELTMMLETGEELELALRLQYVDPYLMAGEIAGVADALVRQVARDTQANAQEERELVRKQRLRERRRRDEVAEQVAASGATSCDYCHRSVAVLVEGAKLCKRHAEELGVRPHGKVGEPEPGELPEEPEA
jgi:hypothetical protein